MFALDIHLLRVSSCKLRGPLEKDSSAQKQVCFGVETQQLLRPLGDAVNVVGFSRWLEVSILSVSAYFN